MTAVDTELVILEGLDFDPEIPCNARVDNSCEAAARWETLSTCCGRSQNYCCDHHKGEIAVIFGIYAVNAGTCINCGSPWAGVKFRPLKGEP